MMTNKGLKVVVGIGLMLGAGVVLAQDPGGEIEAGKRWLSAMNHKGDTDLTLSSISTWTHSSGMLTWTMTARWMQQN